MNFELFSHKTYINIIFCTKYSDEYLGVVMKECVSYFKDHDSSFSLSKYEEEKKVKQIIMYLKVILHYNTPRQFYGILIMIIYY